MVLMQRKLYFPKDPEGVQHFPEVGGGVQMLISIETHITCDFPGGSTDPLSTPLWIRTCTCSLDFGENAHTLLC